jgi:hypothetical protein
MSSTLIDKVWDGAGETWQWLRGVVLGEWEDNRSVSQIVTDALAGFVPGLGSVITLRDLIAVIVRLAKHPEKREEVEEWILLVAMLLPLIITVAGVAVAGVGALVGAELGGFLRAAALFVVKKGGVAFKAMVEFFQAHGYGDVVKALRQVKFAQYKAALVKGLGEQIDKLIRLVKGFEEKLKALHPGSLPTWLPGRQSVINGIAHCQEFAKQLEALRKAAVEMIPKALIEMDNRLAAMLAGDIKAATQVTHTVATGQAAPEVARLKPEPGKPTLRNPEPPEPGNTRRVAERRTVALVGKREYAVVDKTGRPVGAKPYQSGATKLENPPVEFGDWKDLGRPRVQEGWPDMAKEYAPGRRSEDYATFSGQIRPVSVEAGSTTTFARLVSHDADATMDAGAFYNRALPVNGEDMRASSAIKDSWNKDGEYVELRVPPKGDPVWKELHALEETSAGGAVPYKEELKFWEGPAASQVYKKQNVEGKWVDDDWYMAGGKPQQMFDRDQMALLKERGFIGPRKPTNFSDFDPKAGTIVPKDGVFLEVVPLHEAVPPPSKK